jgi:glycosyltransferase involved in cell wall biosynthesis
MKTEKKLFLVCTGLGKVYRGFESHISSLADNLISNLPGTGISVYGGGNFIGEKFQSLKILSIHRTGWLGRKIFRKRAFEIELISFFFFFIPAVILKKPTAIYLGEYKLYCYLFRLRSLLGLNYSLVLYTGGFAIPGLFDAKKDYVHHVTNVYYDTLLRQHFPAEHQFVVPHFTSFNFSFSQEIYNELKQKAGTKKIILSIGSIDSNYKRMDLFATLVGNHKDKFFPVIIGQETNDTPAIKKKMKDLFGENGYTITKVKREELGTYYRAADVFMLCSRAESFGLVFLEALYFNLPVICNNSQEAQFVLKKYAFLINMENENTAINSFNEIITSSEIVIKNEDRQKFVESTYSWDALKNDYTKMFHKILNT